MPYHPWWTYFELVDVAYAHVFGMNELRSVSESAANIVSHQYLAPREQACVAGM